MAEPRTTKFILIENLRFDPENPRLPSGINGHKEPEVLQWMLNDATILELMGAIGERGYFAGEPLLVVPGSKQKGNYTVVEGNRRLAAVKLLRNPELAITRQKAVQKVSAEARNKPDELPVLEFEKRDEIILYLGYRHVTGIKSWDPLAKARYLEQLAQKTTGQYSPKKFQELARAIGSHRDYVARLLTGLAIYKFIEKKNFFDIENLDENTIDFAVLTTAMSYENIVKFLGVESATDPSIKGLKESELGQLTNWLFKEDANGQTRLGESRNLKSLNRIVASTAALKAFRAGDSIHQADLMAGAPKEIFQEALHDSKRSLETARNQSHMIGQPEQSDADVLDDIGKLTHLLREWIRTKLGNN
ncbi:MAG: ParB N-terminal domain-containing protein [candidate division KSB1 bacterium]|mgnify:CR=1 FL=1